MGPEKPSIPESKEAKLQRIISRDIREIVDQFRNLASAAERGQAQNQQPIRFSFSFFPVEMSPEDIVAAIQETQNGILERTGVTEKDIQEAQAEVVRDGKANVATNTLWPGSSVQIDQDGLTFSINRAKSDSGPIN